MRVYQFRHRLDPGDPTAIARTVCFLLSDSSRGISGEIVHVDGG